MKKILFTVCLITSLLYSQNNLSVRLVKNSDNCLDISISSSATEVCHGETVNLEVLPPPSVNSNPNWELLIDESEYDSNRINLSETAYDRVNNYIFSIHKTGGNLTLYRFDLNNNSVNNISTSNIPPNVGAFTFDTNNNKLIAGRVGRDNLYEVSYNGGSWSSFGSGSFDSNSYGSQYYWNTINQKVGFFGGYGFYTVKNWIWENGGSWNNIFSDNSNCGSNVPAKRNTRFTLGAPDSNELYFISGQGSCSGDQFASSCNLGAAWATDVGVYCWLKDLWKLDLDTHTFTNILPLNNSSITQEGNFVYNYLNNSFYIVGGYMPSPTYDSNFGNITNFSNTVLKYSPNNESGFSVINIEGNAPPVISLNNIGPNMAYFDATNNQIVWIRKDGVWGISFDSNNSLTTYIWSTGDTTANISVTPTETTEYWVDVTTNGVTCREYITIDVTAPAAPTGYSEQIFCNSATVADLTATGDNIQWYDAETGGDLLGTETALIDGQVVYASQIIEGCESTDRFAVSVSFQDIQITASTTEVCSAGNVDLNININPTQISGFTYAGNFDSSLYYISNETDSWSNAYLNCQINGGNLVSISNESENSFVSNLIANEPFWIGLTDQNQEGVFVWVDGTIFDFEKWAPNEPSNTGLAGDEDYVRINTGSQAGIDPSDGYWNDVDDIYNSRFVMEIQSSNTSLIWSTGDTTENVTVTPTETTEYWVDVTTNGVTCREYITINVTAPVAPTGPLTQAFCETATVADLLATGDNIHWYDAATGGNLLNSTTVLTDGQMVYASQTVNGCESTDRLELTISIQNLQISSTATEVCEGESVNLSVEALGTTFQNNFCSIDEIPITLHQSLLGAWPFCGNASDISGNNFNGTLNGGVTPGVNRFGEDNNSYIFDGQPLTYISMGNHELLDITQGSISISAWVNTNNVVGTKTILSKANTDTSNVWGSYTLHIDGPANFIVTNSTSANSYYSVLSAQGLAAEQWKHLTAVADIDELKLRLYFDGLMVSEIDWEGTYKGGVQEFLIGSHYKSDFALNYMYNFNGSIDDVAIWNRVLNQYEIDYLSMSNSTNYLWSTGDITENITVTPSETTEYWVDVTTNGLTCREYITINVTAPAAPTGDSDQAFCDTVTVADLTAIGDNIHWYDAATAGNLLDPTISLTDGQLVYATQTINGCESTDRLEVTVSLQDITITASVLEVCAGESIDLSVIGDFPSTYLWSTGESNFSGQGTLVDEYSLTANTVSQNTFSIIPGNNYRLEISGTVSLGAGAGNQRDVAYYIQSGSDGTVEGTPFDSECNLRIWTSLFCDTPGLRPSPDIYDASTHTYNYPFTANSSTLDVGFWDSPLGDNGPNVVTFKLYQLSNSESTITASPTETTEYWVDVTTNGVTCRDYITINVTAPAAPTGNPVQAGCSDFTVGINNNAFIGENLQWYATPSGGSALADNHILVDDTYYYISQTVDGCESSDRFEFLYLAPQPTIIIDSSVICEGDSTTVSVSSNPSLGSATFLWDTGETSESITLSPTESSTFWVEQIYNSGAPENIQTVCRYFFGITVENAPEPPVSSGDILECETIAVQNLVATASANSGESITWYDAAIGGNIVADPSLNAAGTVTYYAEATNDTSGCASLTRTAVKLTITSVTTPTGDAVQSFCDNVNVSDLSVVGFNIQWYDAAIGSNILDPSSPLSDGQVLYASQTENGCESINRLEVSVEIDVIPDPILITTELEFCLSRQASLADLEMDNQGFTLEFYDSFSGGNMLPMDTLLEDGVSYYATLYDALSGCESLLRLEVFVTVIPCEVIIYNALSLNGNGQNDYMVIENAEYFPDNSLEVYNRDGHLLYSKNQYGTGGNLFRGKANVSGIYNKNSNLPTGSYLYVFKYFNSYEQQQYTLKGFLTINSN